MNVYYFKNLRGDEPVADYINLLSVEERVGIRALIDFLEKKGFLNLPEGRKIVGTKNLWEVRYKSHRIFYGYQGKSAILLHAYKKQSQKAPEREIETAMRRLKLIEAVLGEIK